MEIARNFHNFWAVKLWTKRSVVESTQLYQ